MKLHIQTRLRGLRTRLRTVTHARGEPILVYQMGKVGSSTVYRSLRSLDLPRPVYHVHLLNELDALEEGVRKLYPDPVATLAQIEKGRRLRQRILRSRGTTWHVISLVRDPVSVVTSSRCFSLAGCTSSRIGPGRTGSSSRIPSIDGPGTKP